MSIRAYNITAIVLILALGAFVLAGCTTPGTGPVPADRYCAACVGPYDLTLSSHREALGLKP